MFRTSNRSSSGRLVHAVLWHFFREFMYAVWSMTGCAWYKASLRRFKQRHTTWTNTVFTFIIKWVERLRLKCDGTRAETRCRLSTKRTSPFKSAEASVQSTTGSRGVRISGNNVWYTTFRGSVKSTGYSLHSPVSPSRASPCVVTFQLDSIYVIRTNTSCHRPDCLYGCMREIKLHIQVFLRMDSWMFETCWRQYN